MGIVLTKGGWCDPVSKRLHHMKKDRKGRLGRRGLGVAVFSDQFPAAAESGAATRSCIHTEKSFRNVIKSTRNQIVFTIF